MKCKSKQDHNWTRVELILKLVASHYLWRTGQASINISSRHWNKAIILIFIIIAMVRFAFVPRPTDRPTDSDQLKYKVGRRRRSCWNVLYTTGWPNDDKSRCLSLNAFCFLYIFHHSNRCDWFTCPLLPVPLPKWKRFLYTKRYIDLKLKVSQ